MHGVFLRGLSNWNTDPMQRCRRSIVPVRTLARFVAPPFLLLDRFMVGKRGSFDAASAYYFFGRPSEKTLSDREIIRMYRGMHP